MAQKVGDLSKQDQEAIGKIQKKKELQYVNSLNDPSIQGYARAKKREYEGAFKKSAGKAHWRMIASYPTEVRAKIIQQYGAGVLKDEKTYKDLLKTEALKPFVTVPEKDL